MNYFYNKMSLREKIDGVVDKIDALFSSSSRHEDKVTILKDTFSLGVDCYNQCYQEISGCQTAEEVVDKTAELIKEMLKNE